jgi:hypothetical protein
LKLSKPALERLVDALQFCDVLSLYLCCGAAAAVKLDEPKLEIRRNGDEYRLKPSPFRTRQQFSFSALRHPVTQPARSGRRDTQAHDKPAESSPSRMQSGATFYVNL